MDYKTVVIAWSLGGLNTIQLATQFPQKIKKIIFLASKPYFLEDKNWAGISKITAQPFKKNPPATLFLNWVNYPNTSLRYKKTMAEHQNLFENQLNKQEQSKIVNGAGHAGFITHGCLYKKINPRVFK